MKPVVVIISAQAEWLVVRQRYQHVDRLHSPYGEYFETVVDSQPVIFFHGGWGKISAAASTQYAVDRLKPCGILNLGTCGGFGDEIEKGEILLAGETLVYDIVERMGDAEQALEDYRVRFDLTWLTGSHPLPVKTVRLLSADQDIDPSRVAELQRRYAAVAADWESGAIAWVCQRNGMRCLILRGVSDRVDTQDGEAYQRWQVFLDGTNLVMNRLLDNLPHWITQISA